LAADEQWHIWLHNGDAKQENLLRDADGHDGCHLGEMGARCTELESFALRHFSNNESSGL